MFQIESLNGNGQWDAEIVGTDNEFETEADAQDAIDSLKSIGGEWATAEYRVVEIVHADR